MYHIRTALLSILFMGLVATACKEDTQTETAPDPETETVQCISTIDGSTTHDGSKLVFATLSKSPTPQIKDGFVIAGYASTDISPKTRLDDGIQIAIRPMGTGTYPVNYPLGATFSISYKGVGYVGLQGTITVTRYDAVGGWVEGTFEGTANSQDGTKTISVTKGVFKVKRDADGILG